MGVSKTLRCIQHHFFWPHMRQDIRRYVSQCVICQQVKYETRKSARLLQPLPIPLAFWEDLSMDFITELPVSQGFTTIMVVVDRYSKGTHLGPLPQHFQLTKLRCCSWTPFVSSTTSHAAWCSIATLFSLVHSGENYSA